MEAGSHWVTVSGTVVQGHGVASGRRSADRFPGGTLALQIPVFADLGVDLSGFHRGTINVDVSPARVEVTAAATTLCRVTWLPGYPSETFSFAAARVHRGGATRKALLYHPHPETKPEHHQSPGIIEILAPFLSGLAIGDAIDVDLDAGAVQILGPDDA